jgi:hypothetical protein
MQNNMKHLTHLNILTNSPSQLFSGVKRLSRRLFRWFTATRRRKILSSILAILIVLTSIRFLLFSPEEVQAWWNDNWHYRIRVPVTNNTTAENNVYINFTGADAIDTSDTNKFQADCGDIRFTKQNGEILPYYIVSGCGTATTVVHVEFDSFPAGDIAIYYYYGNPSASDGFEGSDFSTEATNYTIGSQGSEEIGPSPVAHWKFDEGYNAGFEQSLTNNEQQINILDREFSTSSTTDFPTDNSLGVIRWDANKYSGTVSVYFESVTRVTGDMGGSESAYASLYTTGGSQVSTTQIIQSD